MNVFLNKIKNFFVAPQSSIERREKVTFSQLLNQLHIKYNCDEDEQKRTYYFVYQGLGFYAIEKLKNKGGKGRKKKRSRLADRPAEHKKKESEDHGQYVWYGGEAYLNFPAITVSYDSSSVVYMLCNNLNYTYGPNYNFFYTFNDKNNSFLIHIRCPFRFSCIEADNERFSEEMIKIFTLKRKLEREFDQMHTKFLANQRINIFEESCSNDREKYLLYEYCFRQGGNQEKHTFSPTDEMTLGELFHINGYVVDQSEIEIIYGEIVKNIQDEGAETIHEFEKEEQGEEDGNKITVNSDVKRNDDKKKDSTPEDESQTPQREDEEDMEDVECMRVLAWIPSNFSKMDFIDILRKSDKCSDVFFLVKLKQKGSYRAYFSYMTESRNTLYYKVSLESPFSMSELLKKRSRESVEILFAIEKSESMAEAEYQYMLDETKEKIEADDVIHLNAEQKILADFIEWRDSADVYWGAKCFANKQYVQCIKHLEFVERRMRPFLFGYSQKQRNAYIELLYKIGFSYTQLNDYPRAIYYLQVAHEGGFFPATMCFVRCLVDTEDPRAWNIVSEQLRKMVEKLNDSDNDDDDDVPETEERKFCDMLYKEKILLLFKRRDYESLEKLLLYLEKGGNENLKPFVLTSRKKLEEIKAKQKKDDKWVGKGL